MGLTLRRHVGDRTIVITCSDREDGDMAPLGRAVDLRRRELLPQVERWSWLHQVHGNTVHQVDQSGSGLSLVEGQDGDGLVARTDTAYAALAVQTADCVPIALYGARTMAVAHAGWKGLVAGIVEASVESMRAAGEVGPIRAVLGPCIAVGAYEFGLPELDVMAERFGGAVIGGSAWDTPALDMAEATRAALSAAGARVDHVVGRCTGSDLRYFSFRTRQETERMTTTIHWVPRHQATAI